MARATKVHPNCQNYLLTTASTVYMLHVNQQLSNALYKTPISLYKDTKPDLYPHVIGLSFSSDDIFCLGMEQLNIFFAALQKNRVIVHPYLPIVTTPLWPLSSFPLVAVWRGLTVKFILLYCIYLPDLVELSTWMFVLAICVDSSLPWQTTNEEWIESWPLASQIIETSQWHHIKCSLSNS